MAEQRVYEVLFIVDPETGDEGLTRLTETLSNIVTEQGGSVTKNETMGRRQLAYRVNNKQEGFYVLFEIEGTGREIAELERRMRVNDQVMRYLTVRVDEERQRAEKLKARRARKASKRGGAAGAGVNADAGADADAGAAEGA